MRRSSQAAVSAKAVLFYVAQRYPQALFYQLREQIMRFRGNYTDPLLPEPAEDANMVIEPATIDVAQQQLFQHQAALQAQQLAATRLSAQAQAAATNQPSATTTASTAPSTTTASSTTTSTQQKPVSGQPATITPEPQPRYPPVPTLTAVAPLQVRCVHINRLLTLEPVNGGSDGISSPMSSTIL